MTTQAHYIVLIRRISLLETCINNPHAGILAAVRPPSAGKVFFLDALCAGRESKD
jgi:hypothetical protein